MSHELDNSAERANESISLTVQRVVFKRSTFKRMYDVMLDGERIGRVERYRTKHKGRVCWRWRCLTAQKFEPMMDQFPYSSAATDKTNRRSAGRAVVICVLSGGRL